LTPAVALAPGDVVAARFADTATITVRRE